MLLLLFTSYWNVVEKINVNISNHFFTLKHTIQIPVLIYIFLFILLAFYFSFLLQNYKLAHYLSFVPTIFSSIICSIILQITQLKWSQMLIFFLIFYSFNLSLKIPYVNNKSFQLLKASILIGIMPFFEFSYIIFFLFPFIVMFIYGEIYLRNFLSILTGLFLPTIYYLTLEFAIFNKDIDFFKDLLYQSLSEINFQINFSHTSLLSISGLFLFMIIHFLSRISTQKIIFRKHSIILFWKSIISLLILLFDYEQKNQAAALLFSTVVSFFVFQSFLAINFRILKKVKNLLIDISYLIIVIYNAYLIIF